MALTTPVTMGAPPGKPGSAPIPPAPAPQKALPTYLPWLGPLYAAALVLIFLGERVTTTNNTRIALSGAGVAGALVVTALRFIWTGRAD